MDVDIQMVRDLGRKCGEDVFDSIMRTALLIPDPINRAQIATFGAGAAIGVAMAAFLKTGVQQTAASEAADALWEKLRPLAIRGAQDLIDLETPDAPG